MQQRVPGSWGSTGAEGHVAALLVEDHDPVLAISDFSLFEEAGFAVALCRGPEGVATDCPLLRGERCDVLDHADVVLHRLHPALGVAGAIGHFNPGLPVVEAEPHTTASASNRPPVRTGDAVLPASSSIEGQLHALRHSLTRPMRLPAGKS